MGTGGVKSWVKEAAEIVEQINYGLNSWYSETSRKTAPNLKQVAAGEFVLKMFDKEWTVKIRLKE